MKIVFSERSWEEYIYWQKSDRKVLERINALIKDIQRSPFEGIGKPEKLKGHLVGYYSRRINKEHRIVYELVEDYLRIAHVRGHY